MPRGDNPNSRANLRTFKDRSVEEVREMNSRGGKRSGEVRRASASLTESLKSQLTPEVMDELTLMLIKRARQGNLKAYELLRDQVGEKPIEKLNVSTVDTEIVNEMKEAIAKRLEDGTEQG